jgi:hypothetical protein
MKKQEIVIDGKIVWGMGIGLVLLVVLTSAFLKPFSQNPEKDKSAVKKQPTEVLGDASVDSRENKFLGETGSRVEMEEGKIYLDEEAVNDDQIHYFNYFSESEAKKIYFFTIKASDGTYRVAANACEVCFAARQGFSQIGSQIRCDNCRVTYSKDQIALEKGGCNPGPITADAPVENGKLVLEVDDIEKVAYLF